jgi:hypothetical protein
VIVLGADLDDGQIDDLEIIYDYGTGDRDVDKVAAGLRRGAASSPRRPAFTHDTA